MQEDFKSNEYDAIFIQDLIKATRKGDKELSEFVNYHLFPKRSPLSLEDINRNIRSLKKMDDTQHLIVKARAKEFVELNNPANLNLLFAIFGLVISMYNLLKEANKILGLILNIIAIGIFVVYLTLTTVNNVRLRSTALFFYELISNLNYDMKSKD
ncbi:hypothetical protein [Anoxybacillus sp. EFIL]|uniref:hypothetical protein n=1 Tax=Anoxybacillus sp. EFIL TaxID=2508869 RepID=UPI00148B5017|nr:hypothetical protein [Anoxybacillus sp. EFIL]NNU96285.1 hypothetical protein [Anoxybacillus sp. EFIL]